MIIVYNNISISIKNGANCVKITCLLSVIEKIKKSKTYFDRFFNLYVK